MRHFAFIFTLALVGYSGSASAGTCQPIEADGWEGSWNCSGSGGSKWNCHPEEGGGFWCSSNDATWSTGCVSCEFEPDDCGTPVEVDNGTTRAGFCLDLAYDIEVFEKAISDLGLEVVVDATAGIEAIMRSPDELAWCVEDVAGKFSECHVGGADIPGGAHPWCRQPGEYCDGWCCLMTIINGGCGGCLDPGTGEDPG